MKKSIQMIIVLLLTAVLLSLSGCGTGGGYGGYSTGPRTPISQYGPDLP